MRFVCASLYGCTTNDAVHRCNANTAVHHCCCVQCSNPALRFLYAAALSFPMTPAASMAAARICSMSADMLGIGLCSWVCVSGCSGRGHRGWRGQGEARGSGQPDLPDTQHGHMPSCMQHGHMPRCMRKC
eukprot:2097257-Rhodomonas_salina.8